MGREGFQKAGLGTQFEEATGGLRHSVKIRNQYAHCLWAEPQLGKMAFVNLEEIAVPNAKVDFAALTQHGIDRTLLQDQLAYLSFIEDCFIYLGWEAKLRAGKIASSPFLSPTKVQRPPLHRS